MAQSLSQQSPGAVPGSAGDRPKFLSLELTRVVCALVVCVYHVGIDREFGFMDPSRLTVVDRALIFSGRGSVAVFFVLSGFVISYASRNERSLPRYAAKRAIRIYPLYVLAAVLAIAFQRLGWLGSLSPVVHDATQLPGQVIANLAMIQQAYFMPAPPWRQPLVVPMWSLSYEVWFYLAFGAFVVGKGWRVPPSVVLLIATVSAGLMYLVPSVVWTYPVYFVLWWMGVEASRSYLAGALSPRAMLPFCVGSALVGAECLVLGRVAHGEAYVPWTQFIGIHFVVAIVAVLGASVRGAAFLRWVPPLPGLVARLGAASYAIYLFHPLVMDAVARGAGSLGWDPHSQRWGLLPTIVVLSVAWGAFFEHCAHRPLAAWLSERFMRREASR